MKNKIKYSLLARISVVILMLFMTILGCNCAEWWGQTFLGGGSMSEYKVKVLYIGGEYSIAFKIITNYRFGDGHYDLYGLTVDKIIQLSESGAEILKRDEIWQIEVKRASFLSRQIEIIAYGLNPADDLFKENIKSIPLEPGILYRVGYLKAYTYFKLIKKSDGGTIILQGNSPNNLREEE